MKLSIIFLVVALSFVIGPTKADYGSKRVSENEINYSNADGSTNADDDSSNADGSSNDDDDSSNADDSSNNDDDSSNADNSSNDDEDSSNADSSSEDDTSAGNIGSSNGANPPRSEGVRLSTPQECARTCVKGEKPKTCYYKFVAENYGTLTTACQLCRNNSTLRLIDDCQCIQADGYEMSGIKVVNRMLPGPSILVCLNDYVVIDVQNKVLGNGLTLHWHGIFQQGYQYYDGVPYVTQCPISEGTSFRYQWRAKNSGTHFWHSHSGLQKSDGLQGAIIVREPKVDEPNNELWDEDTIDNVIFIADWFHDLASNHFPGTLVRNTHALPDNYLINGMGQWTNSSSGERTSTPLATFTVKTGRRHRFRLINGCSSTCPATMTIQGHKLTIIATDGEPIVPVTVDSITSFSAERYDFVISATESPGNYWIQVRGLAECVPRKNEQVAILRYDSVTVGEPKLTRPTYDSALQQGVVLNQLNIVCDGTPATANFVCVNQLQSAKPVPAKILKKQPDIRFYLPFNFHTYDIKDLFKPNTYQTYLVPLGKESAATGSGNEVISLVGKNASFVFPPSTLISQRNEIPNEQFCTLDKLPARCDNKEVCECVVVEDIPLNSVVEIILADLGNTTELNHPYHLHGYSFYVVGEGQGPEFALSNLNPQNIEKLDRAGKIKRNLKNPPAKDTYPVRNTGVAVIRFLANNPGYWFFHCHFEFHLATGMANVFHVGKQSDLPPIPKDFPVCRNFIAPINNKNY